MNQIQKRFDELHTQGEAIVASAADGEVSLGSYKTGRTTAMVDRSLLYPWQTSTLSLLSRVFGAGDPVFERFSKRLASAKQALTLASFDSQWGVFLGAKAEYEGGYLFDVRNLVHAEVFSDELDQADHFLNQGYQAPAAVTAGVVLETTLRKLCEQADGVEPSDKINRMNDDLAKGGVYNKIRADQVRSWAKIRNAAAHGQPDEFDESDVRRMIDGVRDFVANQMR